jgi:HEAT repeat protein
MSNREALDHLRTLLTGLLVGLAVRGQQSERTSREHEDLGPLVVLHERADRGVFSAAVALSSSSNPDERAVCARILGELGHGDPRPFSREAVAVLGSMAQVESDPDVLHWIVSALEGQQEPGALEVVLPFAYHPDSRVRFAVACDPFAMVSDPAAADPRMIETLIHLSSDSDADTRWYALYALANEYPGDGVALRTAFANHLNDPDQKVSSIAREGLAKRGDPRGEP